MTFTSIVKILSTSNKSSILALRGLVHIDLSHNTITEETIVPLVRSFIQMPDLKSVLVEGNLFNVDHMDVILCHIISHQHFKQSISYANHKLVTAFLVMLGSMKNIYPRKSMQVENITKVEILLLKCPGHKIPAVLTKDASLFFPRFKCTYKTARS